MALPLRDTLAQLRSELQTRTGFVNQGAASLLSRTLMDSFLRNAQDEVWYELKYEERKTTSTVAIVTGQIVYDWPDLVDLTKMLGVYVLLTGIWTPLTRGIEPAHDTVTTTSPGYPRRWDSLTSQFEIWPSPDQNYTISIEHYPRLAAFTQDTDRLSLPKQLVFNLALYKAKLHYRQPDAEEALGAHNKMLSQIRAGMNEGRTYRRDSRISRRRRRLRDDHPLHKPIMV